MSIEPNRRQVVAGAAGLTLVGKTRAARCGSGFLWGTAISAHQSKGNNTASDCWLLETITPTAFADPPSDACESHHRYAQDLDIAAGLGLNYYRLDIAATDDRIRARFIDATVAAVGKCIADGIDARGYLYWSRLIAGRSGARTSRARAHSRRTPGPSAGDSARDSYRVNIGDNGARRAPFNLK